MYAIRVRAGGAILEAAFAGRVTTTEALRAVSQAFALAEAGNISRAVCDLRDVEIGPAPGTLAVIAASFAARLAHGQRIAMLCQENQLTVARHFARFSRVGEELGVFTRSDDADAWLASPARVGLSATTLRQMGVFSVSEVPVASGRRAFSARSG